MNREKILFITLTVTLIIGVGVLFIYLMYSLNKKIDPSQCKTNLGDFGVIESKTGIPMNTCGGTCKWNVVSLQQAIAKCNIYKCNAFTYDGVTVKLLSDASSLSASTTDNVFLRQ